jgi:mono/diheme cytochrome c family protein
MVPTANPGTSRRQLLAVLVVVGASALAGLVAAGLAEDVRPPPPGGQVDMAGVPAAGGQAEMAGVPASGGAALYVQHCAACHGVRGEGQSNWKIPDASGKLPAPPHDKTGHTWHHPDQILLDIVDRGGAAYSPQSNMPAFAGILSPAEQRAVLDHIKTFWGPDEVAFQAERTAPYSPSPEP